MRALRALINISREADRLAQGGYRSVRRNAMTEACSGAVSMLGRTWHSVQFLSAGGQKGTTHAPHIRRTHFPRLRSCAIGGDGIGPQRLGGLSERI
jgi:hypothetical protein